MKYGKIRIEDGYLIFTKHMMMNNLPCKDILWAYMRREGMDGVEERQLISNYLVIITRRRKRYKFDMTEREVQECIRLLKVLNPEMAVGFPKGGRLPLQNLWNTRDLGAIITEDERREVQECIRLLKVLNPEMAVGFPKGGRLPLQNLWNTRDLGAIITEDERHILPRRLLRSGDLYHLSLADQKALCEEYRLTTVIDLRTEAEAKERPDTILPGVEYYRIPVLDEPHPGITHVRDMDREFLKNQKDPGKFMEKIYEEILNDQYSVKQYARFIDVLLHHENGAVLWHCSTGKDLTGIATAILLCALGVSGNEIREDYRRTDSCLEKEKIYTMRFLESCLNTGKREAENAEVFFTTEQQWLDRAFAVLEKNYGSVEQFLKKGLYLTPKAQDELRSKYLI